mmetsp:Transcript_543/g.1260  ORF Transcript_543/g.1260 Transcript_543/m.1260 type:complete len:378 (+) Transcript_543:118-1251(+)|eukprot:scaffold9940_cov161-Amphora_coffeaeformis.AAC.7
MALETLDAPQDLAAVPENSKDGSGEDDQSEEPPRRVKMLSRERREPTHRGLSRHSSGNIGPGMLTRERNRIPRAQSMRIVRPIPSASSGPLDSSGGGSGLSRDMAPSTPSRRPPGSRPGGRMRGVSRAKSMADGPLTRSLARSDSGRGMPSRRSVGRTSSQRSLAHMASESSLRPYRGHDKVVNQSIQGGRPGIRRSPEDRSYSDLSSFSIGGTDHSLARQCADPIDDQSYRETNSIADHESCVSGDIADYSEFLPENDPNHIPYDGVSMAEGTLCTFDSVQLRRKQIMATNSNHSFDASSFSTFASGDMNLEGEFEDYIAETGYYDEFYLDTTHVVEEDDAENAENSDSDDEETIEGDVSDNEDDDDDDDDDDDED